MLSMAVRIRANVANAIKESAAFSLFGKNRAHGRDRRNGDPAGARYGPETSNTAIVEL